MTTTTTTMTPTAPLSKADQAVSDYFYYLLRGGETCQTIIDDWDGVICGGKRLTLAPNPPDGSPEADAVKLVRRLMRENQVGGHLPLFTLGEVRDLEDRLAERMEGNAGLRSAFDQVLREIRSGVVGDEVKQPLNVTHPLWRATSSYHEVLLELNNNDVDSWFVGWEPEPGERPEQAASPAQVCGNVRKTSTGTELPALISARDVQSQLGEITWLWEGWVPDGAITLLTSPPGWGKSYVAASLAKVVTNGEAAFPDGSPNPCADGGHTVLWLEYEAGEAANVSRFAKAGGNIDLLLLVPPESLLPLNDARLADALRHYVAESGCRLVVIDSLRGGLKGINENDSEVQSLMYPLAEVAKTTGVPILLLHHTRKRGTDDDEQAYTLSAESTRGSSAIIASARSVITLDKPDIASEYKRMRTTKHNWAADAGQVGYAITDQGVSWGAAPMTEKQRSKHEQAAAIITRMLQNGGQPQEAVIKACAEDGIGKTTVYDTRKALGVESEKHDGVQYWFFPYAPGLPLPLAASDEDSIWPELDTEPNPPALVCQLPTGGPTSLAEMEGDAYPASLSESLPLAA